MNGAKPIESASERGVGGKFCSLSTSNSSARSMKPRNLKGCRGPRLSPEYCAGRRSHSNRLTNQKTKKTKPGAGTPGFAGSHEGILSTIASDRIVRRVPKGNPKTPCRHQDRYNRAFVTSP